VKETGRLPSLAFEADGDAGKLASPVAAESTNCYLGWASQQAFQLDGAKEIALGSLASRAKVHRKEPPGDDSPPGRLILLAVSVLHTG
jgi:hypothetical protein